MLATSNLTTAPQTAGVHSTLRMIKAELQPFLILGKQSLSARFLVEIGVANPLYNTKVGVL